jgi:hypothetical protein
MWTILTDISASSPGLLPTRQSALVLCDCSPPRLLLQLDGSSLSGDITSNGNLYVPDDGQILGNVTLGTQKASNSINIGSAVNFSTVNINGLGVNLNGIVTVNGFPLSTQFTPSGFFSQI